jgi:hypothetical protein
VAPPLGGCFECRFTVYWHIGLFALFLVSIMLAPLDLVSLRLADEGVPLCAIARAVQIPSHMLREQLHEAMQQGTLVQLPHDDWPPGCPRDQRALQLSRLMREAKGALDLAVGQVFNLTSTEVRLLLALLQGISLDKNRSDMASNTVDVHIFHIRKRLAPFDLTITTLRGYGYQLSPADRRRTMDLILQCVADA